MDDQLEAPSSLAPNIPKSTPGEGEDELSSGEDDAPNWLQLVQPLKAKKQVIPQRGDKEFEPNEAGETKLQSFALERARGAMLEALSAERGSSSKNLTHMLWHPSICRAEVPQTKGNLLTTMGHFLTVPSGVTGKMGKQLMLLPEEALYLVERGSGYCWRAYAKNIRDEAGVQSDEGDEWSRWEKLGSPMSVQQAYAEMLGKDTMTLEKYQVYAYLRRLGYTVVRAQPPLNTMLFPRPRPLPAPPFFSHLWSGLSHWTAGWTRWWVAWRRNWWSPLRTGWRTTYHDIFVSLRLIPSGHQLPLYIKSHPPAGSQAGGTLPPGINDLSSTPPSAYEIFYHVWRPSTAWKKTSVPPADFELVVVDARTTRLPTLADLTRLFGELPVQPPPQPRRRAPPAPTSSTASNSKSTPKPPAPPLPPTLFSRLSQLLGLLPKTPPNPKPRVQPFPALKAGRKSVIIAAVDGGNVSFVKFGEGVFEDYPMA
ncbi:hypothetical protein DACRYDRAFT_82203 [Dacryopinax primogenitus]|uniref:tRNA-splicing endonuclease subunit Sen54 N-terminal domain-containing protein n=1 Tax=Dacryopinax primogenitus (strain DJM 731) TaxID=1858805 RepID=M5G7K3_DACPD|nr:uncharacterized protein DACRYDRAFT_82203 [Dacryopinax primogenitus]EJT99752.1 hypothetical protein DACRYDRAFT_82203 [Dacryopinax primogenitus]